MQEEEFLTSEQAEHNCGVEGCDFGGVILSPEYGTIAVSIDEAKAYEEGRLEISREGDNIVLEIKEEPVDQ